MGKAKILILIYKITRAKILFKFRRATLFARVYDKSIMTTSGIADVCINVFSQPLLYILGVASCRSVQVVIFISLPIFI